MDKRPLRLGSVSLLLGALSFSGLSVAAEGAEPIQEEETGSPAVGADEEPSEPTSESSSLDEGAGEVREQEQDEAADGEGAASEEEDSTEEDSSEAESSEENSSDAIAGDGEPTEVSESAETQETQAELGEAEPLLEEDESWLQWPFSKKNVKDRPKAAHRWASAGGFVGMVSRPSGIDSITYRPGIAWGGYIRPEIKPWLGLRLFYREERISADVEPGAFDVDGNTYDDEFEQDTLEVLNLGGRVEPTWVAHPRLRLRGIVGLSWLTYRVPHPRSDSFEMRGSYRSAVQMDFNFGAGLSFDIVKNWVDVSLDGTYGISASRTGSAYEPAQIVRDGAIQHIAALPELKNSLDVLFSLGVIL